MHQADTSKNSTYLTTRKRVSSSLTVGHPPGQQLDATTVIELEAGRTNFHPPILLVTRAVDISTVLTVPEQELNSLATNARLKNDRGTNSLESNSSATGADSLLEQLQFWGIG